MNIFREVLQQLTEQELKKITSFRSEEIKLASLLREVKNGQVSSLSVTADEASALLEIKDGYIGFLTEKIDTLKKRLSETEEGEAHACHCGRH